MLNETLYNTIKNIMIWAMFIQSPWSQLCDFCSQQEYFLESFLCKLDPVTNEVFLLIALLCVLEEEKEDENNRFYDTLPYKRKKDKNNISRELNKSKVWRYKTIVKMRLEFEL